MRLIKLKVNLLVCHRPNKIKQKVAKGYETRNKNRILKELYANANLLKSRDSNLKELHTKTKEVPSRDSDSGFLKSNDLFRNHFNMKYKSECTKNDSKTILSDSFNSSTKGYSYAEKFTRLPSDCSFVCKKKSLKSLSLQKYIMYDYYHPRTVDRRINGSQYQSPNDSHRNKSPLTVTKLNETIDATFNQTPINIGNSLMKNGNLS